MYRKSKQTEEDPTCLKKLGNHQYTSQLSTGLNQLRKESSFCDVTIIVGEQQFPAHKAVLSCASSYFQGMFSTGFQESSMSEVKVPGTEECFAQLLEFAYTGYFSLSLRTAAGILRMACYMVQQDAMQLCAEYLQDVKFKLSMDDCFEVWSIATNHNILKDLTKRFQDHIVGNFPECGRSHMFLENASADVLLQMLVDEDIETDTCGEEQIAEVVLAWLKHDWEHRQTHAADLLKKLRLGLLPPDKLQGLLGEEVLGIPECKAVVEEVRRLDATKEEADVPLIQSHPDMFASRNTITGELSWCHMGFVCKTASGCYRLERLKDYPTKYPYFNEEFCGFTVVDGSVLYVASGSGRHGGIYQHDAPGDVSLRLLHKPWLKEKNFCKYDFGTNQWTVLSPMEHVLRHDGLSLHRLGDFIYAVGKSDDRVDYFIQRYSLNTKEWVAQCVTEKIPVGYSTDITDHAVVDNLILFTTEYTANDDHDAYLLYDPTSNTICEVHNNSGDLSVSVMHSEVDEEGTCFFRCWGPRYNLGSGERFYKAIFDFSGNIPSITVELQEGMHTSCNWRRKDSQRPVLTFDKKKLKMAEIAEECDCHL